jgi:hypothetical protein
MHPDDLPKVQAVFADALARTAAAGGAAIPIAITRRLRLPNSVYTWVHTSGCIEGDAWCVACASMQFQRDKEQQLRSLLLSISHELRTPAQSGLAASQLLAQRDSVARDEEALFLVRAIGASCGLLLGSFRVFCVVTVGGAACCCILSRCFLLRTQVW